MIKVAENRASPSRRLALHRFVACAGGVLGFALTRTVSGGEPEPVHSWARHTIATVARLVSVPDAQRAERAAEFFDQTCDVNAFTQAALLDQTPAMGEAERAEFRALLRELLCLRICRRLKQAKGRFGPATRVAVETLPDIDGHPRVRCVVPAGGHALELEFTIASKAHPRIVDVAIEGASLVSNLRRAVNRVARRQGSAKVLEGLRARVRREASDVQDPHDGPL